MLSFAKNATWLFVAVFALVGCTGGPSLQPSPPQSLSSQAPQEVALCTGHDCDRKEPHDIKCHTGAVTYVNEPHVVVGKLKGKLEVRKANPGVCDRIYWARFDPTDDSEGDWQLTLVRGADERTPVQHSAAGNPQLEAYSVSFYADDKTPLTACVLDVKSQQEYCTKPVTAVPL